MVQILLERATGRKAHEFMIYDLTKCNFASLAHRMVARRDRNKTNLPNRKGLESFRRIDRFRDNADVGKSLGDFP